MSLTSLCFLLFISTQLLQAGETTPTRPVPEAQRASLYKNSVKACVEKICPNKGDSIESKMNLAGLENPQKIPFYRTEIAPKIQEIAKKAVVYRLQEAKSLLAWLQNPSYPADKGYQVLQNLVSSHYDLNHVLEFNEENGSVTVNVANSRNKLTRLSDEEFKSVVEVAKSSLYYYVDLVPFPSSLFPRPT